MNNARKTFGYAAGEELAAPDSAIVAVTGSVEADTHSTAIPGFAFCQYGCDMGAMVLDGNVSARRKLERAQRGDVFGVEIMGDDQVFGPDGVHAQEIANGFLKCAKTIVLVEIPDVLAYERLAVNGKSDGVFE